jgi:hypothetical protein
MMNLSTLFFLVNTESEKDEDSKLFEEINLMEEMDSKPMFTAPDRAVNRILGFAASYSAVQSVYLKEIDLFKN